MGDRGQVRVVHTRPEDEHGSVYLYTHNGGSELPAYVCRGLLAAAGFREDTEYVTRVILEWMVDEKEFRYPRGYGIGLSEHLDNDYPVLVVRPGYPGGTVSWETRDRSGEMVVSFNSFISAMPQTWYDLHVLEDRMRAALLREAGQ